MTALLRNPKAATYDCRLADLEKRCPDAFSSLAELLSVAVMQALDCNFSTPHLNGLRRFIDTFFALAEKAESHIEVQMAVLLAFLASRKGHVSVDAQVEILGYRADFLMVFQRAGALYSVIIECDGHEFHERTKEQAQRDKGRDRKLSGSGYTTLRFTGSEIHRNSAQILLELFQYVKTVEPLSSGGTAA